MTLKSAWITPLHDCSLSTLTLESAEVGEGHQLYVQELTFPETPVDAPKRHTVQIRGFTSEDFDKLRLLLDASVSPAGYEAASTSITEEVPPSPSAKYEMATDVEDY